MQEKNSGATSRREPMLLGESVPEPGRKRRVSGLSGSSEALAIAQLARARPHVVVIAGQVAAAAHLAEEIRFFGPELRVSLFPDWEILPYERFSPPQALIAERMRTLAWLARAVPGVTVLAAHTLMFPVPPPEFVGKRAFALACGERIAVAAFTRRLADQGYVRTDRVMEPGEYAVHGGQLDVYPPGSQLPVRIVLDDDLVEQVRLFDPDTQRSVERRASIEVLPAREYPLDAEGCAAFCSNFLAEGGDFTADAEVYRGVRRREPAGGTEFFLPLFFGSSSSLLDHVPPGAVAVTHREVGEQLESGMAAAVARQQSAEKYGGHPVLPARRLFHGQERLQATLKALSHIEICPPGTPRAARCAVSPLPDLSLNPRAREPFARLVRFLADYPGRALVAVGNAGRRDMLRKNLEPVGFAAVEDGADFRARPGAARCDAVVPLRGGFALESPGEAYVTELEIYRTQAALPSVRAPRHGHSSAPLLAPEDIREGDPVVHRKHGIGFYRGLTRVRDDDHDEEFIVLEYGGGAKLMVPVGDLHMIGRYIGGTSGDGVQPDRLGGARWKKACERTRKKTHDLAAQLVEVQARRLVRTGGRCEIRSDKYAAFAARFGYAETPDQLTAINDTLADLQMDRPMDRLICGDVGFGKTEVALRAAFVAAASGRQVAVLAPTTILAAQHFQVFSDRFSGFPHKVAEFSRLKSAAELDAAAREVAGGEVSVAVGTHRLLQPGFRFKDLGLLVIDEEHRFGVRQKEQLKALRGDVNVLAMTATPIPRTLSMALEGICDFSLISSAPPGRSRVLTFAAEFRKDLVVDAITRELMRGGQVFYVYNDIAGIADVHERLAEWMPSARIEHAHGKTPKAQLERVVRRFYRHECDVLLTTTIVELGIDIPNANTMVIERADRLGLAQLHQLRGRVGRSHHQAYAYLLTDAEIPPDSDAASRLAAISAASDLGGGYSLALRDLEIRGSGNVLGEAQSGQIESVGYEMYRQMLEASVRMLRKEGPRPDAAGEAQVEVRETCLLPDSYCPSVNERLRLYRRLRQAASEPEIGALAEEIADRFGPLPESAELLLAVHQFRIGLLGKGVRRVGVGESSASVTFFESAPYAQRLVDMARRGVVRLAGSDKVSVPIGGAGVRDALGIVAAFVDGLAADSSCGPAALAAAQDPRS